MSDSEDLQAIVAREDAARMLDAQRRMQDGVATYAQLTAGGLTRIDIERAVRRNELRRVHPRVYVNHTGPLTWEQRAWAAALYAAPALLCRDSLEAPRGRDDGRPIHVAIDHSRKVMPQPGIVVHRMRDLERKAYGGTPPRLKVEDNALAMANEAKVERAHGLPPGRRQSPRTGSGGNQFRDIEYEGYALVVELDGALGHDSWRDQARDADRTLDDLAELGTVTARLRFHQVFDTPCQTAARVGRILTRNGWSGTMKSCGQTCPLNE